MKHELESMVDRDVLRQESDADHGAVPKPLRTPSVRYMYSGTIVPGYEEAPYVMNAWNGHIFNGTGYRAQVRAVRHIDASAGTDAQPADGRGRDVVW